MVSRGISLCLLPGCALPPLPGREGETPSPTNGDFPCKRELLLRRTTSTPVSELFLCLLFL